MTQKLLISLNSEKKKFAGARIFLQKILLLPVSLIARFYYIKNLVAGLFSLIARILLLPGSTVLASRPKSECDGLGKGVRENITILYYFYKYPKVVE